MTDDAADLDVEVSEASPTSPPAREPVVFARAEVMRAIEAHGQQDLSSELGGILLGSAACSAEGTLVSIEAAIPAARTAASRASMTFTHDTWADINRRKDRDYPDKRIVGWYHTHPGFGLFLSEHDLFIHRSFFNQPWQVALVVDPRAGSSGFFVWSEGEIVGPRSPEIVGAAALSPNSMPPAGSPTSSAARALRPGVVLAWGMIAAVFLITVAVWASSSARNHTALVQALVSELGPLRVEVHALRKQVNRMAASIGDPADRAPSRVPQPQQGPASTTKPGAAPFVEADLYTVQPGDSLWRIARRQYGDGALWGAIAVANGLGRQGLEPGMKLVIPKPRAESHAKHRQQPGG